MQNDDAPVNLMEMRFHVPSSELAGAADPVEAFQSQVMKQASVISMSGDAIAIFREIHILTPRSVENRCDIINVRIIQLMVFYVQRSIRY